LSFKIKSTVSSHYVEKRVNEFYNRKYVTSNLGTMKMERSFCDTIMKMVVPQGYT